MEELRDFVGETPMIELRSMKEEIPEGSRVLIKLEQLNASGSLKDRPANWIVEQALKSGALRPGMRLLDASSGNTAIGYATYAVRRGISVTVVVPETASSERKEMLRALGAELLISPAAEGGDGSIRMARRLASEFPELYYYANQYDNEWNWQSHYRSTGPEILRQAGGRVDAFVMSLGTAGTMMGVGRFLREHCPNVQLVAGQPEPKNLVEGVRDMRTAIVPGILDVSILTDTHYVSRGASLRTARDLGLKEGLLLGPSSGLNVHIALKVAQTLPPGSTVVTIACDSALKYLSYIFQEEENPDSISDKKHDPASMDP